MYVRPEIEDELVTFGVSGKLWRDSLIMYDRATESLWSQLLGEAVAGSQKGRQLEKIPSEVTTWGDWKTRHPDTLVLEKPPREAIADRRRGGSIYDPYHTNPDEIGVAGSRNPDPRLPGKQLVYGLRKGHRYAAVPFSLLERKPVLNTEAFGEPIVVFSPPGGNAAMAYRRRIGEQELTFEQGSGEGRLVARESESGSVWSWETGECLQGAFEGKSLERISGVPVYWGIWAQFHPGTELVSSGF